MTLILLAVFFYILIGLILFFGQDIWARENDSDYEDMTPYEWLQYFFISVVSWGPALIEFWFHLYKNKK